MQSVISRALVASFVVLVLSMSGFSKTPLRSEGAITPFVCVDYLPASGEIIAYFGYNSTYDGPVTIPVGPNNFFSPGILYRGQPTVFEPGIHNTAFVSNFILSGSSSQITWFV